MTLSRRLRSAGGAARIASGQLSEGAVMFAEVNSGRGRHHIRSVLRHRWSAV